MTDKTTDALPSTEWLCLEAVLERDRLNDAQHPSITVHVVELTLAPDAKDEASIFADVCHEHPKKMEYCAGSCIRTTECVRK